MLRETAKPNRNLSASDARVGTVTAYNGDGSHDVDIGGVSYKNVFSASLRFYRVGERVSIRFQAGKATIVP